MANTKDIYIEGYMPYDLGSHKQQAARQQLLNYVGAMNLPGSGVYLSWDVPYSVPNPISVRTAGIARNGIDTYYSFSVDGVEGFSARFWIDFIKLAIQIGAVILVADVVDMTDGNTRYNYLPAIDSATRTRWDNILEYINE